MNELDDGHTNEQDNESRGPLDGEVPLAGYSDRLSIREQEHIAFKVSCSAEDCEGAEGRAWLTRSICADANPDGPGIIEEAAGQWFDPITFTARHQAIQRGSFVRIDTDAPAPNEPIVEIDVLIWPTLLTSSDQCVLSMGTHRLCIDREGRMRFDSGDHHVNVDRPLVLHQWVRVIARRDEEGACLTLEVRTVNGAVLGQGSVASDGASSDERGKRGLGFCIAANTLDGNVHSLFNGKIEAPTVRTGASPDSLSVFAAWDFSEDISSTRVVDRGPHGLHGRLVNLPARAMIGAQWDGSEHSWKHAPEQYAAIHFHEDDLVDVGWQTDFEMSVAEGTPSGVYVMHIQVGEHVDAMPFYICAPKGKSTARVCVLIPTFTYSIYGNHARPDWKPSWQERVKDWNAYPWNPAEYPGYGLSTYNNHTDGSGICHASHRRPLFNFRPGYITFANVEGSGLRHFQADSHLIAWFHAKGIEYDVITDRELHNEGQSCIDKYDVVMTTTHPEYHTAETLDALTGYRDAGGNLMYLGGNGFYWRIALHEEDNNVIEIRRAEDGIRAWAAEPGEYYNAFDGTYGGLWRRNGRPPQQLVGVGFSAQGQFNGSYYTRCELEPAMAESFAWVFDGIEGGRIGDFGLCGGGAAGFELDRADIRLGTPADAVVLASSEGHGDDFVLVPEEVLTHLTTLPGVPADRLLRADIVWFEVPGGGAVFSVGSITFCGSLPYGGFENNVSRLLSNVMNHMLSAMPTERIL